MLAEERLDMVQALYRLVREIPRCGPLTPRRALPPNGLYLFFERGETVECEGSTRDRIVRVGTHRSDGRFPCRMRQHYGSDSSLGGNKNSSVFRKHVGGALLRRANPRDPRLERWLTQDAPTFPEVEAQVSKVLRENFTFVCFRADDRHERLSLERGLISLLAQTPLALPSPGWLGHDAAASEIRLGGLWNTQHVCSAPLAQHEILRVEELVRASLEPK